MARKKIESVNNNKFVPEVPDDIRFEDLSTRRLVVPEGFQRPETTEEMINRLLNGRLSSIDPDLDDGDDADDFSVDDDDADEFPEDFFDKELPFELQPASNDDSSSISPPTEPEDTLPEESSADSSAE